MGPRCARPWSRATARRRASAALGACALGLCLAAQAGPTVPAPAKPAQSKPIDSKPADSRPIDSKPIDSRPSRDKIAQDQAVQGAATQARPTQGASVPSAPAQSAAVRGAPVQNPPPPGGAKHGASAAAGPVPSGPIPSGPILARPPAVRDDKRATRDWIGRVVPPYPDGYRSNTGGCVGSGRSAEQICARSIGTIDDNEDRSQLLYAAELIGRAGNEARWKITDVVAYPRLQRGERVSISTCLFDGAGDPGVIAVVDTLVENAAARETFDAVRWAVRLDRSKGRFVEIKAAEVQCYNEGAEGE